jgi:hypothetical protein
MEIMAHILEVGQGSAATARLRPDRGGGKRMMDR